VVGVILNLALVFGVAVIWSQGLADGDWFAAAMSIVTFVPLYRFKADVLWKGGGMIGLVKTLLER
jgi:hypothetical protein